MDPTETAAQTQAPGPTGSPESEHESMTRKRRFWLRATWISAIGIVVPPFFGLAGTILGMLGAFETLSATGQADPEALAGDISIALITTLAGLAVSLVFLIIFFIALIRFLCLPRPMPGHQSNHHARQ